MPISFIPVRDQARVIIGAKESTENKGQVLKRISTGKKVAEPRDNISDFGKISTMKLSVDNYANAIKSVSIGVSKLETALSVNKMLEEQYGLLIDQYNELLNTDFKNAEDQNYLKTLINANIDFINNLMESKFNSESIVWDATTPSVDGKDMDFTFDAYNDLTVTSEEFALTLKIVLGAPGTAADFKTKVNTWEEKTAEGTAVEKVIADLKTVAEGNKTKAQNNYKLILAGVSNLENINKLAKVQKTNTEAAISALEDIDVQDEMVNLMQAQILEELSSEALVKIKESSRYIVSLIRA